MFSKKHLSILFTLLGFFLLGTPEHANAQSEFTNDYDVSYRVLETGVTEVIQQITTTNKTDRFYITEYSSTLGTDEITQVSARSPSGEIPTTISKSEDSTQIKVHFRDQIAGKGNQFNWELRYLTTSYAEKVGRIWEVDIPKLGNLEDLDRFNLTLEVPASFRTPAYMFPQPVDVQSGERSTLYLFDKNDYFQHGVSAAFGEYQVFSFELDYHLKNTNLYPVTTEIALPPDTSYQTVILEEIIPEPKNVSVDKDGNWLAEYELTAGNNIDVVARGQIQLYPQPKSNRVPILTDEERQMYLNAQKYWEINDAEIRKAAAGLTSAEDVYRYVVDTLSYDQSRLEGSLRRKGAATIMQSPSTAVCMEFTDLFIALARAVGIPAREVNGFAYTKDPQQRPLSLARLSGDVLHAWPEYYHETRGWVPVDPTWGATTGGRDYFNTFDLNHIVFAIHGAESEWPPPAGAYKYDRTQKNDVKVEFVQNLTPPVREPVIDFEVPDKIVSGIPAEGELVIANHGTIVYPQALLELKSEFFSIISDAQVTVPQVPPFGQVTIPVKFTSRRVTETRVEKLTVSYDDQRFSHPVTVQSFLLVNKNALFAGGGVLGVLFLFFVARRARRLSV